MLESGNGSQWERQTLQKVLLEHITEQRRARRWGIFFKLALLVVVIGFFVGSFKTDLGQPTVTMVKDHTALIDIKGEIGTDHNASADNIRKGLLSAFQNKHVKGVVLRINSPGGSPVQARQVFDLVRALRAVHPEVKIYAAIEDLGTSAAYLIACAAESIYTDKTSLVGSIGVRLDSFGFVDAMQKVGVERRLYTGGSHKGILDPFLPRNPADEQFIDKQLAMVHQAFIQNVKDGRGARLHESPDVFSGLFWCGEDALSMGLIDGYGDVYYIAKHIVQAENLVDYTSENTLLDRLTNHLGSSIGQALSSGAGFVLKGLK
jgi:protease-4